MESESRRDIITDLGYRLEDVRALIADKDTVADKRKLAIAATNIEQAILWLKDA